MIFSRVSCPAEKRNDRTGSTKCPAKVNPQQDGKQASLLPCKTKGIQVECGGRGLNAVLILLR